MVRIRTPDQIIADIREFLRTAQPNLDTKPGTVSRDLLVDGPATQLANLYEELARISSLQSLRLSLGIDLDRLGQNFGATRRRGSSATGQVLVTLSALEADININQGDLFTANNGATFFATTSQVISPTQATRFRATAARFRADLDFVGITDEFAAIVNVQASAPGTQGNISTYSIVSTAVTGITNVTNAFPFGGGTDAENDASFRNRVLAIFSGANTGTEEGYRNTVLADPGVLDAIVVQPGDPLMTRDGTVVAVSEDGTRTIISEGTGGKIDIYVFGTRIQEFVDSYVYIDRSNRNDPTDPANDFILGQIPGEENLTITQRRRQDIANGILPNQPVNNIISVVGSSSGGNFVERQVDGLGRVTGNYELVRDTGAFGGSPFGFDRLRWISDRIVDFTEDNTKTSFNGQDPTSFTDVLSISGATQNISVVNENSTVNINDRTSIQLAHKPVTNVTRVLNVSTGEQYVVANQNPDGTGSLNETGRIVISGQTLPGINDVLQVDYTWVYSFDPNFDFDNRTRSRNPREAIDSIDWGYSNAVRRERETVVASGTQLTVTVIHPISSVISVNTFVQEAATVTIINGRLAVVVVNVVANVVSITRDSDGSELFDTADADASFNAFTIFLPTDTVAQFGDIVTVVYNATDVFNVSNIQGSFESNVITLATGAPVTAGAIVECNYIANVSILLPATALSALPAIRSENNFNTLTAGSVGFQPFTNIFVPINIITQNLREAPTPIGLTIAGSISPGVLTVTGTTFKGTFDFVTTNITNSLTLDLTAAIKSTLGIASNQSVPGNVQLIRLISVEKVTTTTSLDVLSVDFDYDIQGYALRDNSFVKRESIVDSNLSTTQVTLPSTPDNLNNIPQVGDRLRVTFYISTFSDTENVSFSRAGTLYTDKIFALVDTISISSGFTSVASSSATLTVTNLNQPANGTRYQSTYDYLAPKNNERITIRSNANTIIQDSTISVENTRPINADVLVKAATPIQVDITMTVVVSNSFINSATIVLQNVQDALTSELNSQELGERVDDTDLIAAAYTVDGIERVDILFFNVTGEGGRVRFIQAQENQFIIANNVIVTQET